MDKWNHSLRSFTIYLGKEGRYVGSLEILAEISSPADWRIVPFSLHFAELGGAGDDC